MTTVEITAIYRAERIRFDNPDGDVLIADADFVDGPHPNGNGKPGSFAVKGPDVDFDPQQTYRFYGHWSKYTNKRTGETHDQFHFQAAVKSQPHNQAGVIRYIAAAGAGKGIGPGKARKLWEKFGADAVRILREQPDVAAAAITGLSVDQATMTGIELEKQAHIESCSIELMSLLDRRGFPKATVKRCLDLWGNQAAEFIQRNPYVLLRFRGCGFKLTDAMYLDVGHSPARLKRQALCAWHKLASNSDGHTWFPVEYAIQGIRESVAGAELRPAEALNLAKRAKVISTTRTNGRKQFVDASGDLWVSEGKKARNERYVARRLVESFAEPPFWPRVSFIMDAQPQISRHQLENLITVTSFGTICSLGGSPGTGKTFVAAAIVSAVIKQHGERQVAIAAPTGKAAVRVTEALQEYGISKRARTIHSLLEIDQAGSGDGWSFVHKKGNPLDVRFLIVDEASMIDTDLMASLLAARASGTHLLFVGDVNQLAPVSHGAPLRDMITSGIAYGELTEIRRYSGQIVQACADIRDGKRFETSPTIDLDAGNNFYSLGGTSNGEMLNTLDGIFEQVKSMGFDPVWETQVVVPVNKKSELSRVELNKRLQEQLNSEPGVTGQPFRVGDKIVNTKNGFYSMVDGDQSGDLQTNDRGEVYVANGELARVVQVEQKLIVARLSSPKRTIRIPRGGQNGGDGDDSDKPATGCSWDLGYALSVHKSQGSEWAVVIVVLDEYAGARRVCDRSWTYTAISRAKNLCLLLGRTETAHRFCTSNKIHERKTFLAELVKHDQSVELLTDI